MAEIRTFNQYNFVTGAVDGTLAYDFSSPAVQPVREPERLPKRRRNEPGQNEWIREDEEVKSHTITEKRPRLISPMGVICGTGAVVAAVLLIMMLFAQIRLISISDESVALQNEIEQLQTENDRLTVEYETVFNLKDVEEYATDVLGMQEARDDQIYYLTDVSSADRAVVVTDSDDNVFSMGAQEMAEALNGFVDKFSSKE